MQKNSIGPISVHELRHTFISICKNVPLEYLKLQVGHSKSMDTLGIYGHTVDGELDLTKDCIQEEFGKLNVII